MKRLSAAPRLSDGDVLVVGCLRNEALRLPDFLAHHRALGVDRFLLIDNGSDDGSTEYLLAQSDVYLFHTHQPYSASRCGVDWINAVLDAHARGHWALILDVDELFIYPGYERAGLTPLLTHLEAQGAEAMAAPMLDMYPDGALAETEYAPGQSLIDACPLFDATGYSFRKLGNGLRVMDRGGPRQRLFWDGKARDFPPPVLTKFPLVRWRADLALTASTHTIRGVRLAASSGLLLHFKFLQDFAAAVSDEAARQEHFMAARQYVAYAEVAAAQQDLRVAWEGSTRYTDSWRLVALGLMQVGAGYPVAEQDGGGPAVSLHSER